jgi:hypothetical protein
MDGAPARAEPQSGTAACAASGSTLGGGHSARWPPACSMRQPPSAVAPWPNGDDLHRGRAAVWASAYEIDANRRNVALGVSVIGKAQQEA